MRWPKRLTSIFLNKNGEAESCCAPVQPKAPLLRGIFCDVQDTIVGSSFGIDHRLVEYLNAKYMAGEQVTVFSTGNVYRLLKMTPLHKDLIEGVRAKQDFYGKHLEIWIDDLPNKSITSEFERIHPKNPHFREMIEEYLSSPCAQRPPEPSL